MSSQPRIAADLRSELDRVAVVRNLLVVVDVDGTIAEIAPRPEDARVLPGAQPAMTALAGLPGTRVAVVSGRSHAELLRMLPAAPGVLLVGGHGTERAGPPTLDEAQTALRERLVALTCEVAAQAPGAIAEVKPTGAALHVRLVPPQLAGELLDDLRARVGDLPGVRLRTGKMVLEVSVLAAGKADCVRGLRAEHPTDAVVFVGDDDTDEDAMAVLGPDDLGVRVGPGETLARCRVPEPAHVVTLLEELLAGRRSAAGVA